MSKFKLSEVFKGLANQQNETKCLREAAKKKLSSLLMAGPLRGGRGKVPGH